MFRIHARGDEVDEVQGEDEVGDEFAADDDGQEEYDPNPQKNPLALCPSHLQRM